MALPNSSETHVNIRPGLAPLASLVLAVCGLLFLGAGLPILIEPSIAESRPPLPAASGRSIPSTANVTTARLAWTVPRTEISPGTPARGLRWRNTGRSDQTARPPSGTWIGQIHPAQFTGLDLRLLLRDMAIQGRRGAPAVSQTCPCPMLPADRGPR